MADEIRPIRAKLDYEAALKEIGRLWGTKAGTRGGDRPDVLATLVYAYEGEHHPMDSPDPLEAIKFRHGATGAHPAGSGGDHWPTYPHRRGLNRKRGLSIAMIRRLHARLGISAEVLIRPSRKSAA